MRLDGCTIRLQARAPLKQRNLEAVLSSAYRERRSEIHNPVARHLHDERTRGVVLHVEKRLTLFEFERAACWRDVRGDRSIGVEFDARTIRKPDRGAAADGSGEALRTSCLHIVPQGCERDDAQYYSRCRAEAQPSAIAENGVAVVLAREAKRRHSASALPYRFQAPECGGMVVGFLEPAVEIGLRCLLPICRSAQPQPACCFVFDFVSGHRAVAHGAPRVSPPYSASASARRPFFT